jgi:hypothetical protein
MAYALKGTEVYRAWCRAGRVCLRLVALASVVLVGATGILVADEPSKEFWPETDIWLRLSPEWRISTFIALSKNIETSYREGNVLLQADYAWGTSTLLHVSRMLDENRVQGIKALLARGGFLNGRSLDDQGQAYRERTIFLEGHARTPFEWGLLVSNRVRTDLRWLGEDPEFSARLRYRLMIEKEVVLGNTSLVPYVNAEPYYDTRYSTVNRVRLIGGASVSWFGLAALEANVTYQHDTRSSVTELYALNVILHFFFQTNQSTSP